MNQLVEQNLSNLVQELTTSGSRMLNEEKLKQLKQICKQDETNIELCYRLLIVQLDKYHSEIRYSAFQIIDQLFHRSHRFRTLLLTDLNYLIDKCLGLDVDNQLPPPKPAAKLLKQFTATSIKKWHEKFGTSYKLLDIGFNYLKNCKFFNFDNIDEPIGITATLQREREEAQQIRLSEKLQNANRELNETSNEIYSCIKQAENCLNLLLPSSNNSIHLSPSIIPTELSEENEDDDDDDDDFIDVPLVPPKDNDQELLQLLGLGIAGKSTITVEIDRNAVPSSTIEMTDDNRALIENLHDLYRQLHDVYLKQIQSWIKIFIQTQQNSNGMKRAIDLKNSIQTCLKTINNARLAPKLPVIDKKPPVKIVSIPEQSSSPTEPTAPVTLTADEVNYFFKGDSECLKRSFKQVDVQNAFVRPVDSEQMPDTVNYAFLMHKRTFVNELPPIKWKCRASMGNEKLCERMDRYKCPFHGRIIARNEQGQAVDETIRLREEQVTKEKTAAEWQDPAMLEDIRLATGIDLRMDMPKKKKKTKMESGLTELGIEEDTVRKRLEKKLLNPSSLKRIGAALDSEERRRNHEKFHHQFNYALNN